MQSKKREWLHGSDFLLYPDKEAKEKGKVGCCMHCWKEFGNERTLRYEHKNFCTMLNSKDETKMVQTEISSFTKSKVRNKEDEKIREIVLFICETATPINAVQNKHFRTLTMSNYSSAKIREEIIRYSFELKEETKKKISHRLVSFVVDGATINSTSGWYAVGLATRTEIYFYDVYHLASTTTIALSTKVNEIIDEIQNETNAKVIGACTDNAPNIANVFNTTHKDGIAINFSKYLLRVPCQAHTTNLVDVTYCRENPEYNELLSKIKAFCSKASSKKIHELLGINRACPLIREQRWFTEYEALSWVVTNRSVIEENFDTISELIDFNKCPINDDWELLLNALAPLHKYTRHVESDVKPLGESFDNLVEMKTELLRISDTNKFARDLLDIVIRRWSSTSDEDLLKLAYFVTPSHFMMWRRNYILRGQKVGCGAASLNERLLFHQMNEELSKIIDTTVKYGHAYNFDFEEKRDVISYLLTTPKPAFALTYFWEMRKAASPEIVKTALEVDHMAIDVHDCENIFDFYNYVSSLPSSEAFIERVFSNMRALFPVSRSSVNDDLIRAQTLVRIISSLNEE